MNLRRWAESNSKATAVSQDRKATDDGFSCKLHDTGLRGSLCVALLYKSEVGLAGFRHPVQSGSEKGATTPSIAFRHLPNSAGHSIFA